MPMRTNTAFPRKPSTYQQGARVYQQGISLLELVVFIVVVSIALSVLMGAYQQATRANVDPLIRVRALEAAQSKLDEIMALKYDEQTPSGGVPACSSSGAGIAACNDNPDANMNDVDDFHGFSDSPYTGYSRQVTVVASSNIKLITVSVTMPNGDSLSLAAERANF